MICKKKQSILSDYNSDSGLLRSAYFKMHISIFLWGFTGILGKLISLNEGLLVWYRMFLSAFGLLIFLFIRKKQLRLPKRDFWRLTMISGFVAAHWICFYGAIKYSNVSVTLSSFATLALFTAFLEPIFLRKKLQKVEILLGSITLIGIIFIFQIDTSYHLGIILAIGAAILAAVFTILNKQIAHKIDSSVVSFYQLGMGWVILTFFIPFYIDGVSSAMLPSTIDWIYLIVLSFLLTSLTFVLSMHALKYVSSFTMNLSVNLEPIYGIILAFIIFDEQKEVNANFYIGAGIILSTVVLHSIINIYKNSKKKSLSKTD